VTPLSDIDFAALYREHWSRTGRTGRPPAHWDTRAGAMNRRAFSSPYVTQFVARMNLDGCATLLDVGCGPGTIALSVAARLSRVYGLDFSPGMLEAFAENARVMGIAGATPILRGWEDDWTDVPTCDLVVASRSTAVADLEAALLKLDAKAARRVYLTYPSDGRFVDAALCQAIGRPTEPLPDYLYVIGILHHLGIEPRLDYLQGENLLGRCASFGEFRAKVGTRLGSLTSEESDRLAAYFDGHPDGLEQPPMRWAFIWWETRR
jgi:SAM-dependent methyltransferase